MIDNVIKKYIQNDVNKTNTGSMPVEMSNIETRYFKLPFIGMYSKVTQNKIEKLCKRFCKNAKVKLVFTSDKLRQTFSYKDSYPSVLSSKVVINLFGLAVMLVMLVKCTNISQPGLMNSLVRIKSHIYI